MSNYFIVRVNTPHHNTLALAMADMAAIIEQRGYWKKSVQPTMPVGSPMIAVGGHGGRGLFLHGIVRSRKWKRVGGGAEGNPTYQHKLGMQWDHSVYMHDPSAVDAVLKAAGIRGNPPILRSHSQISQHHYTSALLMVLSGDAVNPWEYDEEEAAA
jgi:hypothetical protein